MNLYFGSGIEGLKWDFLKKKILSLLKEIIEWEFCLGVKMTLGFGLLDL